MCFFFKLNLRLIDCDNNHRKNNTNHNHRSKSFSSNVSCIETHIMPKIPNLLAFGKHCHNCGKWMQRRALRKDVACNFCDGKIFVRKCKQMQMCSRCVECDNIILDNFNYCECCGLETIRQLRITKARALSNLFPKNQTAPVSSASTIQPDKSQDLFEDFRVDNEELTLIEESLVTDDVSSDNEKKQESMLSVSSYFISLEEEEKEKISNGWQTPEET
ncbi:uncharacterized protein LOC133529469 [Cydia pomonella]|uniref:uncharacterized protein LOC133529469 n=1 Tax=Cydia pomonella TaxID=82600 RepID=UPI002ADE8021|nr:uncharacterized protein LOC133529469 [Cydia pomonella]